MITSIRCPDCSAPLTGALSCAGCGLPLTGPNAARLWQVDQELASLTGRRDVLLTERLGLLGLLRGQPAPAPAPSHPQHPLPAGSEASPRQVQNVLLSLGALLLAGAGVVFTAVTYRNLGVVGRALILLTLTVAAGYAPVRLRARGLDASAETVGAVALALAALDAVALRRAGVAASTDSSSYAAVATTVLAALTAGYAAIVPLRLARLAAIGLAQLPVLLLLQRTGASAAVAGGVLAALAAVDLAAADLLRGAVLVNRTANHEPSAADRVRDDLRRTAATCGAGVLGLALALSVVGAALGDRAAAAGLLAIAAVVAGLAVRVRPAAAGVVPLLAAAATVLFQPTVTERQLPLVPAAVALLGLLVVGLLPRWGRTAAVVGALLTVLAPVVAERTPILTALAGPASWLATPWTLASGSTARQAVSIHGAWTGTLATLVVIVIAAACAVTSGLLIDRLREALLPAGTLTAVAVLLLPLSLGTSYELGLVLLLVVSVGLAGAGLSVGREVGTALALTGGATGLLAVLWSTADQGATLAVLPVAALIAAGLAVRAQYVAAVAALLVGAELAAVGAAQGLAAEQVGGLLLVAVAGCLGASLIVRRLPLEVAAGALAVVAVLLTTADPGWLSWSLAAIGLGCLALAVRPDRRQVAVAGGLLLSASSWVRLGEAHVTAPEPYVLPLAVAALMLGYLRRRSQPGVGSVPAYGPGLSLLLMPSLLASLSGSPTRGLLLLPVAALVVVLGRGLRAPLLLGAGVLIIDALNLLLPYASSVPRWTLLAAVGTALVVLGATYEQRRSDLDRLRTRFAAMG